MGLYWVLFRPSISFHPSYWGLYWIFVSFLVESFSVIRDVEILECLYCCFGCIMMYCVVLGLLWCKMSCTNCKHEGCFGGFVGQLYWICWIQKRNSEWLGWWDLSVLHRDMNFLCNLFFTLGSIDPSKSLTSLFAYWVFQSMILFFFFLPLSLSLMKAFMFVQWSNNVFIVSNNIYCSIWNLHLQSFFFHRSIPSLCPWILNRLCLFFYSISYIINHHSLLFLILRSIYLFKIFHFLRFPSFIFFLFVIQLFYIFLIQCFNFPSIKRFFYFVISLSLKFNRASRPLLLSRYLLGYISNYWWFYSSIPIAFNSLQSVTRLGILYDRL